MKCKLVFILMALLMSMGSLIAANDAENEDGVVLTPHKKVCVLPDKNAPVMQQTNAPSIPSILRGSVAYGNDLQHANVYHFDLSDPANYVVDGNAQFTAFCGDFYIDDPEYMWIIDYTNNYLKQIHLETLEILDSVEIQCPLEGGIWSGLAIHKTTDQMYGIATSTEISVVYEINPFLRSVTELVVLDIMAVISCSFDMDGTLYMFDIDTDQIFTLDVNTLYYEPLGAAGFDGNYAQGMGLDPVSDEVYLAAYVEAVGAELRLLDKTTGNTTFVESLPGETGAFGFPGVLSTVQLYPGMDQWMVIQSNVTFGEASEIPPIPADFFGPGSEPFEGQITFMGSNSLGAQQPASDFSTNRMDGAELTGPEVAEVNLDPQELNLKSIEPGQFGVDSFFDIFYEINFDHPRSGQDMIFLEDEYGGSFTTLITFYPVFTFIEVGNPGNVLVYSPETPITYFSPEPYPWTLNPIPGDFDPYGDEPMVLISEMGNELEMLPLLSRDDFAFLMMDETGVAVEWDGTGYNNGQWYEYPNYGWWNVWLYDHPFDLSRNKVINATFNIMPMNPDMPVDVTIVYNFSTGNWPGWRELPRPPLPDDVPTIELEDELIGRTETIYEFEGFGGTRETIINDFVIEGFNPEWVSIDVMGSNFMLDVSINHVCFKPYTPPVIEGGTIKVGKYLQTEEWNRWIGSDQEVTKVEYLPEVHEGIQSVEFFWAFAGSGDWMLFDSDDDGQTGIAPGPVPIGVENDGWSGYLDHDMLPDVNAELDFRARVYTIDSFFDVFTELPYEWDVTPPSSVTTNLYDFIITYDPYILLEVLPESANIAYIEVEKENKEPYFEKGIPPAQQDPGSMDCGPTALAACLKYFEANGHPDVCGGYDLDALIEFLKNYCKTDPNLGTYDTDLESGARAWIEANGGGFSVSRIGFNWQTMRNELERSQDVITLFNWQDGQGNWGGHFMTFNSISNIPEPDGTIKIDFMDPASGEIIDGYLDLETGTVSGFTDSNGNVIIPDGAEVTSSLIICPNEPAINPGTGTIIEGPIPAPYPIPIETPGMYWIRINIIDEDGNKSRLDYPIIAMDPVVQPQDMVLYPANKTNPEPWYQWITDQDEMTPVSLRVDDPDQQTELVRFYFTQNPDLTNWQLFDTDDDGFAFLAPGPSHGYSGEADGWCGYLPHDMLTHEPVPIFFKAELQTISGDVLEVECERTLVYDPSPPSSYQLSVEDGFITDEDILTIEVMPDLANLDYVVFSRAGKDDWYQKEIPFAPQQDSMSCGPYALAACLKYFANKGYDSIDGGLEVGPLAEALKPYVKYNADSGTLDINLASGAQQWIDEHGGGFTVSGPSPFSDFGTTEMTQGVEGDGLANGISQNIIPLFQWIVTDSTTGKKDTIGHFMTMSSVHNGLINGKQRYDFMDPGDTITWYVEGNIDPETGVCNGFSGEHPPDGTIIFSTIMICPLEPAPNNSSGGTITEGPDLEPVELALPDSGRSVVRVRAVDEDGNKDERDIVVTRVQPAQYPPGDTTIQLDSPPLKLEGGTPEGGSYYGPYVVDGFFYPIEEGIFPITYAYTYPNGFITDVVFNITVLAIDFGDCPDDPYPTLIANDGARHVVDNLTYLGTLIDAEADGQPNAMATGDDIANLADEDGITFGPIMPGSPAQITIDPKINPDPDLVGFLQGWMDFNRDGDWDDPGEQIFMDEVLHFSSPACLLYNVPANVTAGPVYARFRFSTVPGLNYFGLAPDGEVEDYLVEVVEDQGMKWLQEPCPELSGLHCHDYVIPPDDYDYTTIADDWQCNGGVVTDIHWWGNYENVGSGINHFHLSIHETQPDGCLPMQQEIWGMDVPFNMANETLWSGQIFSYEYVLDVPFEQVEGKTYWLDITAYANDPLDPAIWRWKESDRSTVPYHILCPAVSRSATNPLWNSFIWTDLQPVRYTQMAFAITSVAEIDIDFGDAPDDPYPTLLASDGARHTIDGITYLGDLIDAEVDGQPNTPATGDDIAVSDDEDGVVFRGPLVAGSATTLKVKASVDGKLNVWLDVNRNGFWGDAGDHVFVNYNLVAGWNTLLLNVPASAKVGISYMRFRFSQEGGETYYGASTYGEVEDYQVKVYPENWGFILTPVPHTILVPINVLLTNTTLTANDAIGVWYEDDYGNMVCGGADIWDGTSDRVVLAYADDNTTPEKDGFDDGEVLTWTIHHTGSGTDEVVSVLYDATFPQSDGKFASYGLSKLTEITGLSATAVATPTSICAGDPVQLDVIVTGGSGSYTYSWSSNPPGFSSNLKNPVDYPTQYIVYTVVVDDGVSSVSSSVGVSVQAGPTADAGDDVTICETDTYQLNATATNYSALSWTTSGDGVFDDAMAEDPVYVPGTTDIANGSVVLTLLASPILPCVNSASSSMEITFAYNPTADAGPDGSVCVDGTYQLDGAVTSSNVFYWSTAGDGTFDDVTLLDAIYAPGSTDVQNGQVTLTLTANAIAPCQIDAVSSMTLIVLDTQKVSLFTGWNGLSSNLSPIYQNNNSQLFGSVLDNLVLVYNFDGTFWPAQGTNSLIWDEESGYVIKLEADDEMIFCGDDLSSLVVNLDANWNIIPVLSETDADITSIFDGTADVKLVLEVAGWKLFWPDYSINTILNLETGMSYFVFMNAAGSIDYANASSKSGETIKPALLAETPWNEVNRSPAGHVVAFSDAACEKFVSGDMIGAFTNEGLCAGIAPFEAVSTGIILKGDDPYTLQVDGFANEETVNYELYRTTSGDLFDLQVEYNPGLDHSGRYHDFGMSAVTGLKLQPTGILGYALSEIRIYPNPSHGIFNIDGISGETEITVYDAYGNMIHEVITNENTRVNLSEQADGIYLVKIKTLIGTHYQKVVIN